MFAVIVFVGIMALESDYTSAIREEYFGADE
jgi:cytochrome c oxidase subunit IV